MLLHRLLLLCSILLTAIAGRTPRENHEAAIDWDNFYSLVNDTDEPSIHSILHSLGPKYKHGVIRKDNNAIEQAHSEDPALATILLKAAKHKKVPYRYSYTNPTTYPPSAIPSPTIYLVTPSTPAGATAVKTTHGAVVFHMSNGGLTTIASPTAYVTYRRKTTTIIGTYTLPNGNVRSASSVVVVNEPSTSIVGGNPGTGDQTSQSGGLGPTGGAVGRTRSFAKEMAVMLGGAAGLAVAL